MSEREEGERGSRSEPEGLDLPGPSRRIRVEPLRLPEPARRAEPAPPEPAPEPRREPQPDREPVPQREPV